MLRLPRFVIEQLDPFAQAIYGESTWEKAHILVIGAMLATGKRTISAVLRVMGLSQERNYPKYHQVLSRASWSGLTVSLILLRLLLKTFAQVGEPLVFGIDETIERRRGDKIKAKGISGAFEQRTLCEGQWAALDKPDVVDVYSVGTTYLGITLSNRVSAIRALL